MDEQNQNIDPVKPVNEPQQPNPAPTYMAPPVTGAPYAPISVPTNSLAIVSLVSSILSWVFLPLVGGIVGLVTGIMARKEIKQGNGAQGGDGMATVGIIVGAINIVFTCLVITCGGALIFAGIASDGFR
jgi:Domain of unknown function (DUF4190)